MYAKSLSMGQWLEAYLINPSDFHLSFDFEGGEIEASYLNIRNHKFLLPLPDLFSPSDDFDQAAAGFEDFFREGENSENKTNFQQPKGRKLRK